MEKILDAVIHKPRHVGSNLAVLEKYYYGAVLYPVAIGPFGTDIEPGCYLRETLNAPFSAFPFI